MKQFEVKYTAKGVMLIKANSKSDAADIFINEQLTTNEAIAEGVIAELEMHGEAALELLSVELESEDFTEDWKYEVLGGHTRLGYDEWVRVHKKEVE